jgi:hypothetical protein
MTPVPKPDNGGHNNTLVLKPREMLHRSQIRMGTDVAKGSRKALMGLYGGRAGAP